MLNERPLVAVQFPALWSPSGPKVQQHHFAVVIAEPKGRTVGVGPLRGRRRLADPIADSEEDVDNNVQIKAPASAPANSTKAMRTKSHEMSPL